MSIDKDIEALERALEAGPTEGGWFVESDAALPWVAARTNAPGDIVCNSPDLDCPESLRLWFINAAYIAACSPEVIRRLLDERAKALSLLKKCRDELNGLPRSLGYDFTHTPELDAFLREAGHE